MRRKELAGSGNKIVFIADEPCARTVKAPTLSRISWYFLVLISSNLVNRVPRCKPKTDEGVWAERNKRLPDFFCACSLPSLLSTKHPRKTSVLAGNEQTSAVLFSGSIWGKKIRTPNDALHLSMRFQFMSIHSKTSLAVDGRSLALNLLNKTPHKKFLN